MRGATPWPPRRRGRIAIVVGLFLALFIVAMLVWVIGTFPRPGWQDSPASVPTAPAPRQ
ncbi:MAG: hypothetical protein H0X65_20490 [Gemmatimonadetes bacterium]|jgi:hypothetical protein|nr:hypothetical protein [Gemmatimonadota bacterium]